MAILNDQTKIGLSNRFFVKIEPGDWDLGSWQKCEGLDVTWDMPEYRVGDQGNLRVFFPGNTKYTPVKLIRAACDDTAKVQEWLNTNAWTYTKSQSQVAITLFDASGAMPGINTWHLKNALPKKWSINSMDAGSSQVSIETLEFEHQGFLNDEQALGG
jgi:phage tail-like protein